MPRYALDLELDGRAFAGTQWQKGQRTVQAEMLAAVAGLFLVRWIFFRRPLEAQTARRTD